MKKSTKWLLLAALVFFAAGAAFGIASLCAGFRYSEFERAVEAGEFTFPAPGQIRAALSGGRILRGKDFGQAYDGVRSLRLDTGLADCTITLYGGTEWKVSGSGLTSQFRCRQDGDTLRINGGRHFWNLFGAGSEKAGKLEVLIPEDQVLEEARISIGIGRFQAADEENFLRCRELELDCGVGGTVVFADVQEKADVDCGVGSVRLTLAGSREDFDCDIDDGIGSVTVSEQHSQAPHGSQEEEHHGEEHQEEENREEGHHEGRGAGKKLEIDGGVGPVEIVFSDQEVQ